MEKNLTRKFFATGIGSMPHTDPNEAVRKILDNFPDIPFWPQLPKRSFFENMYAQFMDGFPGAVIDNEKKSVYINTSKNFTKKLEETYQRIIDNDIDFFSMSKSRAEGFYLLLDSLKSHSSSTLKFIKGQITGPVSFGLSVTKEDKKPILYDFELSGLATGILASKIKWQIKKMKEISGNIIIFIDEPYLVSIGSSYVNIKRQDVMDKIVELRTAIHSEGALAGIHCCGNTDWSLLLGSGIDILSFDAYNYTQSLLLYPAELKNFLDRGGFIAWGIVPTSKSINEESPEGLVNRLEKGLESLAAKGISKEKLLDSSLITPSCGCATLNKGEADKVLDLTSKTSQLLKEKYS